LDGARRSLENEVQRSVSSSVSDGIIPPVSGISNTSSVRKHIYGDNRTSTKGVKALINAGASGDIFELVENSKYIDSEPEKGKKTAAHKNVSYWDYFVKTVQIDNSVFDLVANIRKKRMGTLFIVYS